MAIGLDLGDFLQLAWTQLMRAVPDQKHGFHWPVAATVDEDGAPHGRVVVLRSVAVDAARLTFHTDRRSPKAQEVEHAGRVALTFHDGRRKLQVRANCRATVERSGELFEAGWAMIGTGSKRCYLAPNAPSGEAEAVSHNLPEHLVGRIPEAEEVAPGIDNFAVVACVAEWLDVLELARPGHRRARFWFEGGGLQHAAWVQP